MSLGFFGRLIGGIRNPPWSTASSSDLGLASDEEKEPVESGSPRRPTRVVGEAGSRPTDGHRKKQRPRDPRIKAVQLFPAYDSEPRTHVPFVAQWNGTVADEDTVDEDENEEFVPTVSKRQSRKLSPFKHIVKEYATEVAWKDARAHGRCFEVNSW
jgi:hypothetical protein